MTARRVAILQRLINEGSLPRSACSRALLTMISPLMSGGVVAWEKAGAGQRLVARNISALRDFLHLYFPKTELDVNGAALRVQGVARFRDTKILRGTGEEIVCIRAWRDGILRRDGKVVPVAEATQHYGLFSFLLRQHSCFSLHGQIATVENPTAFTHFEHLGSNLPLALYVRGCVSRLLRNWLASQAAAGLEIVHFGDYDPSGLAEYLELRAIFGNRARLYVPPNLSVLFRKYSNRQLLRQARSQNLLQRLRNSDDASVKVVVELMDETNAALEQEALLVDHPSL
jgi:hypothetical protein